MSAKPKIFVYDTTLRDGSQGENISFSLEDKLHIARKLDDLGVDYIEGGQFEPASVEKLRTRSGRERREFASHICRYCDVRFSCSSYRGYALASGGRAEFALRQYLTDFGTDLDQQDWLTGNLEVVPAVGELE